MTGWLFLAFRNTYSIYNRGFAMLIDIIAGARPNFMKIAPIIRALEARKNEAAR